MNSSRAGMGSSTDLIPALELCIFANEYRVTLKHGLGVKLYENEGKGHFCNSVNIDVMGGQVVSCIS